MDINKYIKELVIRNECIILPGFGGFETRYKPAFHDKQSGKFNPPSKKIIFKPEYKLDNGILMNYIAEKEKLEITEAKNLVDKYIQDIIYLIDLEGTFTMNRFGKIIRQIDGTLEFIQLQDENYLIDSFGLSDIQLTETGTRDEVVSSEAATEISSGEKKSKKLWLMIAALFIFFAGLIFLSVKYNFIEKIKISVENKKMNRNKQEKKIVFGHRPLPVYKDSLTGKIDEKLHENTEKGKALYYKESKIEPVVKEVISKTVEYGDEKRYLLVAGSFTKESFATEMSQALKKRGYNPEIIKTDNDLFRVVLEAYLDIDIAIRQLEKLKKDLDNSVWILRL